jgi:hypothetical protein
MPQYGVTALYYVSNKCLQEVNMRTSKGCIGEFILYFVGFEVLTAAMLTNSIGNIMPCSPSKVTHFQNLLPASCWFLTWLIL